jgi:metal-responsive CopG/Arc/MetJ family transcriptional regulator
MKTDVFIPNPIFEAAERLSQKLGMSRNELYAAALTAYLEAHQDSEVTKALDEVYATESSTMAPELVQMQVMSIAAGEDW